MAERPFYMRKRGAGWQVVIRVDGERHQYGPQAADALKGGERPDVEEWAWTELRRLQKAARRKADGLPGPLHFSQLLEAYKTDKLPELAENTRTTYAASLGLFEAFFVDTLDDPRSDRIRAPHIRRFLKWRAGRKAVSPRTLAKDRAVLHAVFTFAAKELEIVDSNPVANVSPPKSDGRDPVILDNDQYERLIRACKDNPMLRLYVLVLGETGARSGSEALWLKWQDVKLDEHFIWIASDRHHRTKSGKGRWVPMTARLRQAMRDHFAAFRFKSYDGQRSPWIFHHPTDRRRAKAGERIASLRRGFDAAAGRAKLPEDFVQHDLRHRRVTSWIAEGRDVTKVREAVGHADLRTTMSYTHLAREHLRSLVEEPAATGTRSAGTDG